MVVTYNVDVRVEVAEQRGVAVPGALAQRGAGVVAAAQRLQHHQQQQREGLTDI